MGGRDVALMQGSFFVCKSSCIGLQHVKGVLAISFVHPLHARNPFLLFVVKCECGNGTTCGHGKILRHLCAYLLVWLGSECAVLAVYGVVWVAFRRIEMNYKKKMTDQDYRDMKANDPFKPVILSQPKLATKATKVKEQ
jgi:hypothetical protein